MAFDDLIVGNIVSTYGRDWSFCQSISASSNETYPNFISTVSFLSSGYVELVRALSRSDHPSDRLKIIFSCPSPTSRQLRMIRMASILLGRRRPNRLLRDGGSDWPSPQEQEAQVTLIERSSRKRPRSIMDGEGRRSSVRFSNFRWLGNRSYKAGK